MEAVQCTWQERAMAMALHNIGLIVRYSDPSWRKHLLEQGCGWQPVEQPDALVHYLRMEVAPWLYDTVKFRIEPGQHLLRCFYIYSNQHRAVVAVDVSGEISVVGATIVRKKMQSDYVLCQIPSILKPVLENPWSNTQSA